MKGEWKWRSLKHSSDLEQSGCSVDQIKTHPEYREDNLHFTLNDRCILNPKLICGGRIEYVVLSKPINYARKIDRIAQIICRFAFRRGWPKSHSVITALCRDPWNQHTERDAGKSPSWRCFLNLTFWSTPDEVIHYKSPNGYYICRL